MAGPRPNRNDPRARHEQQAFNVTTAGLSRETGRAGYGRMLMGTPTLAFEISVPQVDGDYEFSIAPYLYGEEWQMIRTANAGTFQCVLTGEPDAGPNQRQLIAASTDATDALLKDTKQLMPENYDLSRTWRGDRIIRVTTNGMSGEADKEFIFALFLTPSVTGWK